ncbi:MAG: Gfo/Idh/MocA family oxidoreductase, partial [Candidatus Lokiarchaeota archaeon]|nr:Gfo/Idh/MocA family oxidoreductase [Candidatus Lokiarchaeota archaeon]
MEKLKAGIIGSGFIAEHHALAYAQLQNVEIIGISSLIEEQARALMARYKVPGKPLPDYKDLLKLKPDVVSVCLPNFLHKDVTIDVLNSGAHALVEKPLARNVAEGKAMIAAEKKSGKKIFYCENNMYAPTFAKVKEVIDEGALGKIYMGRGREQHSGPHSQWFYKKEPSGGGVLVVLGIHDIACLV